MHWQELGLLEPHEKGRVVHDAKGRASPAPAASTEPSDAESLTNTTHQTGASPYDHDPAAIK